MFGQLSAVVVLIVHVVHLTHGLWHRVFLTDAHCKKAVNSILRRASSVFVDCFSLHLGDRRCGCIDHRRFRKSQSLAVETSCGSHKTGRACSADGLQQLSAMSESPTPAPVKKGNGTSGKGGQPVQPLHTQGANDEK